MKRSNEERTQRTAKAAVPISEEGTSTHDSPTNQRVEQSTNDLPPWKAECILSKRSRPQPSKRTCSDVTYEPSWAIRENDWWGTTSNQLDNIPEHKASGIDDCHSDSSSTTGERQRKRTKRIAKCDKSEKQFYNIGLHTWNQTRAEWKSYKNATTASLAQSSCSDSSMTDATTQGKLSDVPRCQRTLNSSQYRELVRGITNVTREYELSRPMNLRDLIEVYVDVWENSSE